MTVETGQEHLVAVMVADLSGFTAMSEIHGDAMAAAVGADLLDLVRHDATTRLLTKGLGDGVLVVDHDARMLAGLAFQLVHAVGTTPARPRIRVALHHGRVMARSGDAFGRSINLVSRLVDVVPEGRAVATQAFVDAAGPMSDVETRRQETVMLRDIASPIVIHHLDRCRDDHLSLVDPVCRMTLDPQDPTLVRVRTADGAAAFCSEDCAARAGNRRSATPE